MKIKYEHTDTFGGEANYSWVNRGEVELPDNASDLQIVRTVKAALGMSGVKCDKEDWQGMIVLYPRKICQVIFIGEML
jgi:hypothetical protein